MKEYFELYLLFIRIFLLFDLIWLWIDSNFYTRKIIPYRYLYKLFLCVLIISWANIIFYCRWREQMGPRQWQDKSNPLPFWTICMVKWLAQQNDYCFPLSPFFVTLFPFSFIFSPWSKPLVTPLLSLAESRLTFASPVRSSLFVVIIICLDLFSIKYETDLIQTHASNSTIFHDIYFTFLKYAHLRAITFWRKYSPI